MMNIRERYFEELCHIIQMPDNYLRVVGALYDTPYRWHIPDDMHRSADCKPLRDQFMDDMMAIITGDDIVYMNVYFQTTLLEVLIALSRRCVDIADTAAPFNATGWFWEFLKNLGLTNFDDQHWNRRAVQEIVRGFLANEISVFPIRSDAYRRYQDKDWNEISLWYQMQFYIEENYPMR